MSDPFIFLIPSSLFIKHAGILSMKQPTPHRRLACASAAQTTLARPSPSHEYRSAQGGWGNYSCALTAPRPKRALSAIFHNTVTSHVSFWH